MDAKVLMQLVLAEKLRHCEAVARIFIDQNWIESCRGDGSTADLEELMDFSSGIWGALVVEQQIIGKVPDLLLQLLRRNIAKLEAIEDLEKSLSSYTEFV
jgi:hypothetical protein